jgi:pyruvate dehydrogenase E1 component alpha subunit/2-oxoisovalerate dehydrogenase E1 component alpha subunit
MRLLRVLDERMLSLQRAGRVGFYGQSLGQEAAVIGAAAALRPEDWVFPALREGGAMLWRGYPLARYLHQVFGSGADTAKGRQMPAHQSGRAVRQVSWSSCIGTQLPQAVGAAMAARLLGDDTVVLACLGDGATSTGDFHAAMNLAGVQRAPVVFLCQNNHWSISVPVRAQTATATLAEKAAAYGMPGVRVDGNDVEAVWRAAAEAVARARAGEGPALLEAVTYRMGPHSSADDPSRYREEAEVERWRARDPLVRAREALRAREGYTDADEEALLAALHAEVSAAIAEAEAQARPGLDTLFEDVYAALPWHLEEQRRECLDAVREEGRGRGG